MNEQELLSKPVEIGSYKTVIIRIPLLEASNRFLKLNLNKKTDKILTIQLILRQGEFMTQKIILLVTLLFTATFSSAATKTTNNSLNYTGCEDLETEKSVYVYEEDCLVEYNKKHPFNFVDFHVWKKKYSKTSEKSPHPGR